MISKFAKAIGIIGAVTAIVWAMRDRFISVAVSREPEPPAFKTPTPGLGFETVSGIGPVYASRLTEAGYGHPLDLVGADAEAVAIAAGVSKSRARTWIDQVTPNS